MINFEFIFVSYNIFQMSVPNTFCSGCVSDPCAGICKLPAHEYCDYCGGECDGCCKKHLFTKAVSITKEEEIEHDLKRILMNTDEYVKLFLIRLKEELQRRTTSNTSAQTPSK